MSEFPLESGYYDSDPSDYLPATVETKQKLTEELSAKTTNEYLLGVLVRINIVQSPDGSSILALMFLEEGTRISSNGKTIIGYINKIIPSESGLEERICYSLANTPDGTIEIEKDQSIFDPEEFIARMAIIEAKVDSGETEQIEELMELSAEEATERMKAIDESRELGLSFVSQQEAEQLLLEVGRSEPFDINKLWPDE